MLTWFSPLLQGAAQTQSSVPASVATSAGVATATGIGAARATGVASASGVATAAGIVPSGIIYISPTGNDTTGDGSIGNPYKKISKAVSVVSPGDTIRARGGTYAYSGGSTGRDNVTGSGTAGNLITIENYPGETPIFDGNGLTSFDSSENGAIVKVTGSYLHFKGLEFTRGPTCGLAIVSGNNNIVENCKSYRNGFGSQFEGWGFSWWGTAANNLLLNNDAFYNRDTAGTGGNGDGFYLGQTTGSGNIARYNRSYLNSDDGFDLFKTGAGTQGAVTIDSCWSYQNGYAENNTTRLGDGMGFKLGGNNGGGVNARHTIKNAIAWENAANGYDPNDNNSAGLFIYNCTAFGNIRDGTAGWGEFVTDDLTTGAHAITNCLSLTASATAGTNDFTTDVVLTTNSWQGGITVSSADFVSIDPTSAEGARQSDGSLPVTTFLNLVSGSDLIDAGTDVGIPYQGSAPDIGSFEFTVGASVASSAGVATGAAVGRSLALTTATSAGAATVLAVGRANALSTVSSAALATVTGVGRANVLGTGASVGLATTAGVGRSNAVGVGASAGTAVATGAAISQSVGAAESTASATAQATGQALALGVASSAGTATAQATGSGSVTGTGVAESAGVATALATGQAIATASFADTSTATVISFGASLFRGVGASAGVATTQAQASSLAVGVATSAGAASTSGVGRALSLAQFTSSGIAVVTGQGVNPPTAGTGTSVAGATVNGIGGALAIGIGSAEGRANVQGRSGDRIADEGGFSISTGIHL